MTKLPDSLQQISLFFERLPGIGSKTANRLAFYLLRLPQQDLAHVAEHIGKLKENTKKCSECFNLTESDVCRVCQDTQRDSGRIMVVEDVLDLLSLEQGNIYDGLFHVLHGKIDPLNHIGPDDIYLPQLMERIQKKSTNGSAISEVILATNPDMEGEATAMYIRNRLQELKEENGFTFTVTRLAYGLPMGANLEYADYLTLGKALENRNRFE